MLNGISKSERIDRVIEGLKNDCCTGIDVLADLARLSLSKMTEKEIKGWYELHEDMVADGRA